VQRTRRAQLTCASYVGRTSASQSSCRSQTSADVIRRVSTSRVDIWALYLARNWCGLAAGFAGNYADCQLGQSGHTRALLGTSALPLKADIRSVTVNVSLVPILLQKWA
jgi:hypothetical protein